MFQKISNRLASLFVSGFWRNSFFSYLVPKLFRRNKYVLALVGSIIILNIVIIFLWVTKISGSGFAIDASLNSLLNVPYIPRSMSLLATNLIIVIANFVLAFLIYKKNKFVSIVMLSVLVLISLMLFAITLYYIYSFGLW